MVARLLFIFFARLLKEVFQAAPGPDPLIFVTWAKQGLPDKDRSEFLTIYNMKAVFLLHIAVTMLISASCSGYYGHDINLSADIDHTGAVCSPDSSLIYFVCHARAWQKGRNLWFILPVEGQARNLYNNVSLYCLDTAGTRLTRLFDCGDLPYSLSRWKAEIVPSREGVTFSISPGYEGWDEKSSKDASIHSVR